MSNKPKEYYDKNGRPIPLAHFDNDVAPPEAEPPPSMKPLYEGASARRHGGTHILARLDRDGHTDLATHVRAKELSADAAAVLAGYPKQPTPLEHIRELLPQCSDEELDALAVELKKILASRSRTRPGP